MKSYRPNLLVICGRNKRRSRTAEHLFKNEDRFSIRSAGLSPSSDYKVAAKDISWANLILVMEKEQSDKLKQMFSGIEMPIIRVLDIPDDYEFMEEELVEILNVKVVQCFEETFQ